MAEALASCRTKCKHTTCPLQVKKILAELKALGEHHRELGCASALLHEIRMQVRTNCVAFPEMLHSKCHQQSNSMQQPHSQLTALIS